MIKEIVNSYYNGEFDQMREQIKESDLCICDLVDKLYKDTPKTDIIGILKLFLIKEGY